jgi:hypothetical protein
MGNMKSEIRNKDFYLSEQNSYERLLKEYNDHGSLVVAYDFDNTVYDFHRKGWQFNLVIDLLRKLKSINCYLIVFTANADLELVVDHLTQHNIPFDSVNENPPFYKSESRKIYYNILLDDRAGLRECFNLLTRLYNDLTNKSSV